MANSREPDTVLCLVLLQLAFSTHHKCVESVLLPSLLRGECAGRKADRLGGCLTGLLLISTLPVSRSSGAFWPRAGHQATGSQSVNKAMCCRPQLQPLWTEGVRLFSSCMSEAGTGGWGYLYLGKVGTRTESQM